jgi:hypothetical protein
MPCVSEEKLVTVFQKGLVGEKNRTGTPTNRKKNTKIENQEKKLFSSNARVRAIFCLI